MQSVTPSPPRVLLLDALGTLLELRPAAPALRLQLRERFGVEVTPAQAQTALAAEIAHYRAHLHEGRDAESLRTLRRRCAEVLREALPATATAALAGVNGDAFTAALLAALQFSAFPDARPALTAARARGERLVVVSNWDVSLLEVLERVGLASRLDGVVTSAQIGAGKPAPEIFAAALAVAGCEPAEAVHVGDSVPEDVEGARTSGLRAVLVRRDGRPGPPGVRTIVSLAELP